MSKKTAVKWLVEKLNQCEPMYSGVQSNEHKEYLEKLVEQAKEMEKEQMISFYLKGCDDTYGIDEPVESYDRKEAEDYYNKTYKNS